MQELPSGLIFPCNVNRNVDLIVKDFFVQLVDELLRCAFCLLDSIEKAVFGCYPVRLII